MVQHVDPQGRWLSFCQARHDTDGDGVVRAGVGNHGLVGDAFTPYLWFRGEEIALEQMVAVSPSGKHVVVRERGAAWLVDTDTAVRIELPLAPLGERYSFGVRATFDPASRTLLYVRSADGQSALVLHDLASGRATQMPVSGVPWRAWFDDDGTHVWADVVTSDTDGDGKLALPMADTNLVVGECSSTAATSSWGAWSGDAPVRHAMFDRKLVAVPGGLAFFGEQVLVRNPDGALVLQGAVTREVAPAACRGRVWQLDAAHDRILFTCIAQTTIEDHPAGGQGYWAPLFRYDHGVSSPVGVEISASDGDSFSRDCCIDHTKTGERFDFDTGAVWVEPERPNNFIATHEGRGLIVLRSGKPCVVDLASGERTCFSGPERIDSTLYVSRTYQAGPMVITPVQDTRGALVDIDGLRVVGMIDDYARVQGVTADGWILDGAPGHFGVLNGPLRWRTLE